MRWLTLLTLLPVIIGHTEDALAQNGAEPDAPVSLRIEAPNTIKLGATMIVRATVSNNSGRSVFLVNRGVHRRRAVHRMGAEVRDSRGDSISKTAYGWIMLGFVIEEDPKKRAKGVSAAARQKETLALLEAGASYMDEFDLTKEFELARPGRYSVVVVMNDPLDAMRVLTSNTITFTVTQ
jgi:hypothetical protein